MMKTEINRFIRLIYAFSLIAIISWVFWSHSEEIAVNIIYFLNFRIILFYVFGFIFFLSATMYWMRIQKYISPGKTHLTLLVKLRIYMAGYLGRYLPGKIAVFFSRILFMSEYGYSKKSVVTAAAYEQIITIFGSLSFSFIIFTILFLNGFYFTGLNDFPWLFLAMGFLILIVILCAISLQPVQNILNSWFCLDDGDIQLLNYKKIFIVFLYYLPTAFFSGLSFFLVLWSGHFVCFDWRILLYCIAAYNLSAVGGMLAIFAPGGIGIREGLLVLFILKFASLETAILVSFIHRILLISVELQSYGIGYFFSKE